MNPDRLEPLTNHPKYQKVGYSIAEQCRARHHPACTQVRNLNSGTFGFVVLALDKTTGRQVAIKFIGA